MSSHWHPLKLLLVLVFLLTAGVAPAWSQMVLPPPVPPGVAPAWAVVPTSPKVFFAPNIPADLFLVHKRYYYYYAGYWYQSKSPAGPWVLVQKKLPPALARVSRSYFKTPPPW